MIPGATEAKGLLVTIYTFLRDWVTPVMLGTLIFVGGQWKGDIEAQMVVIQRDLSAINVRVVDLDKENDAERQHIRLELEALRLVVASLPNSFPPDWFKERVDSLEKRLERLEQRS